MRDGLARCIFRFWSASLVRNNVSRPVLICRLLFILFIDFGDAIDLKLDRTNSVSDFSANEMHRFCKAGSFSSALEN